MASKDLRKRVKWQDISGQNAKTAETDFFNAFSIKFQNTSYRIESKPMEFKKIYVDIKLQSAQRKQIYNPKGGIKTHGVIPDYVIRNVKTGKSLYVEVKRQDGWVEGGQRSDGRGNAHERSCKFFTPGLLKILRKEGKLGDSVLPFWTVFRGNITRDPCRVREITCWYDEHEDHYFFWRDGSDPSLLIKHFEKKLKKLLD